MNSIYTKPLTLEERIATDNCKIHSRFDDYMKQAIVCANEAELYAAPIVEADFMAQMKKNLFLYHCLARSYDFYAAEPMQLINSFFLSSVLPEINILAAFTIAKAAAKFPCNTYAKLEDLMIDAYNFIVEKISLDEGKQMPYSFSYGESTPQVRTLKELSDKLVRFDQIMPTNCNISFFKVREEIITAILNRMQKEYGTKKIKSTLKLEAQEEQKAALMKMNSHEIAKIVVLLAESQN